MAKQKIAIIGAGPSGLSAALHLTAEPDWSDRYDITIYQLGWRAGGKGATGRGVGERIEEHGIHGFTSFYYTATGVVRDCYRELYPEPEVEPIGSPPQRVPQSADEVFLGNSFGVGTDFLDGKWDIRDRDLPTFDGAPWDDAPPDMSADIVKDRIAALVTKGRLSGRTFFRLFRLVRRPLSRILSWWVGRHARRRGYVDPKLGRLDFLIHLLSGLVKDKVLSGGLDALDGEDFRTWLRGHGVNPLTLGTSVVQTVPNILFQYSHGDTTRPPRLSAASYLGWVLRTFAGRGHAYYFFRNGTGEGIILPMYETLRRRGVRFEFFHKLTQTELDGDRVTRLHFDVQAELADGVDEYQPLRRIDTAGQWVWPDEPLWDQLATARPDNWDENGDFEWWWSNPPVATRTLDVGADFDAVVMAVPPSVWELVLPDAVTGSDRWAANHTSVPTTATLAAQIWLLEHTETLGWERKWDEALPYRWLGGGFPNPYNAVVDFSDLIDWEEWEPMPGMFHPQGLIYFCGQLDDRALIGHDWANPEHPMHRPIQRVRAESAAFQYFRNFGVFLPGARRPDDDRTDQTSIDFEALIGGFGMADELGESNFVLRSYTRANVSPNERYCTAPPGTAAGRMKPWESGLANLVPAGDWVYTGINVGCFEGAVIGGALASHALIGSPKLEDLPNYTFLRPELASEQVMPLLG